ncbi:MAG: rhomboid family intramembrane serine protease [Thermoanaerobaculia bacterium]
MYRRVPATMAIVGLIIFVFVIEITSGMRAWNVGQESMPVLYDLGAVTAGIFVNGQYWRLLAAMFLHIGLLHIALNLWALYQLGAAFELMFGKARFLLTYFVSGLVASSASSYWALIHHRQILSAGASGAIFGILGALIIAIRRSPVWRHQPWARSLTHQLIFWALLNVFLGFTIPGIDNTGHLGGFAAGLLLGFIPHKVPPPPARGMTIDVGE